MRRGQAAMEFLMTYGWAIFVVLMAIGALAYFGVLSPDKFLSDKCMASPPFACTQYKITGDAVSNVNISLQNGAGIDLVNMSVRLSCSDGSDAAIVTGTDVSTANGETQNIVFTCPQQPVGDRFKANYTITYLKAGEEFDHYTTGTLAAKVE
jgi:hypothetical protein